MAGATAVTWGGGPGTGPWASARSLIEAPVPQTTWVVVLSVKVMSAQVLVDPTVW